MWTIPPSAGYCAASDFKTGALSSKCERHRFAYARKSAAAGFLSQARRRARLANRAQFGFQLAMTERNSKNRLRSPALQTSAGAIVIPKRRDRGYRRRLISRQGDCGRRPDYAENAGVRTGSVASTRPDCLRLHYEILFELAPLKAGDSVPGQLLELRIPLVAKIEASEFVVHDLSENPMARR